MRASYRTSLDAALAHKRIVFAMFAGVLLGGAFLYTQLSSELTPPEDRGMMMAFVNAPEGSGFEYTSRVIEQVEGSLYLVRGDVVEMDEREVVLDAGLREVVVVLDGHANPVGYQQPAQVRGRALD